MTASTGAPALTMIIALRGRLKRSDKFFDRAQPEIFFPLPRSAMNFSVTSVVRLKTATEKPFDSMLSARFSPITPRPMIPISHCFVVILVCLEGAGTSLSRYFSAWQFRIWEVSITDDPLEFPDELSIRDSGAVIDFWGIVRGIEDGREIEGINYEVHQRDGRASDEFARGKSENRFFSDESDVCDIGSVLCAVGEASLFPARRGGHRAAAFCRSQWLIEELKQKVPIWKRPCFQNERQSQRSTKRCKEAVERMNWANRLTLSRLLLTILFVVALNSSWAYGRTAALDSFSGCRRD